VNAVRANHHETVPTELTCHPIAHHRTLFGSQALNRGGRINRGQDLLTPPHVCREVASRIPGAAFEVIKGAGSSHVVPIERPDDFNGVVTRFLS
jgi:pimeloyl-ACP methyl ester carboxylesterase